MDYKDTLNLPKTGFSMKAGLPQREPGMLKRWKDEDVYGRIMEKNAKSKRKYILHDGPPYSNGDIHMGHVLNKILKDIVVKFNAMLGHDTPFVPGWDCHGLPVEHQLMKNLNIRKDDISQVEFRGKARDFALNYVDIQKNQFERLGIFGDWKNPYLTLDYKYEGAVIRSFAKLVAKGYIYKALKPVNWCFNCETALAEAEVEYETRVSPSVFVKFKLSDAGKIEKIFGRETAGRIKGGIYILIWTTTPWTLLANTAIALSPSMKYTAIRHKQSTLILAKELLGAVGRKAGFEEKDEIASFDGKDLEGMDCLHPFIARKSKVVLADYVSREEGTGCVHIAPGHGQEDHIIGKKYNLSVIMPVNSNGRFDDTAGEFKNLHVLKANEKIIDKLKAAGSLLFSESIRHSYPHCWRCGNPIIFRATAQYFMNVDHDKLRDKVGGAIKERIKWLPPAGKGRISAMVGNRPDWCISRQRLWGIPITAFYCSVCNELLLDENVIDYIAGIFEKKGSDAWFTMDASELIPQGARCRKCKNDKFIKESDIFDVWFESGVSHQAVLKVRGEFPADLYLEGSDQHRGWFQSAIISSMAIDGAPPYKSVLTHGFVVDGKGKKMSKSLGNVISPEKVMKRYGADILRIWVASCDYRDDVRISDEILNRLADAYRKIRNTCRFILGNLSDFDPPKDGLPMNKWPETDKWALWRTSLLLESAEAGFRDFAFHKVFNSIYNFCVVDMSSLYLDVLKDRLYTSARASAERRSAQSALSRIINILSKVMAPVLAYTAEEIKMSIPDAKSGKSIHLENWPDAGALKAEVSGVFQEEDVKRWSEKLLPLRESVLKAMEEARSMGVIGSSLDAEILLHSDEEQWKAVLNKAKPLLTSLFIVSSVEAGKSAPEGGSVSEDVPVSIKVVKAKGEKCRRCWNYSASVGKIPGHPGLCDRCGNVMKEYGKKKEGWTDE